MYNGKKMADRQIVLSDVLCFTVNKFVNNDVKTIKAALSDFYTVDDLHVAKMRLVDDVDKLTVSTSVKHPHIPHRRDGDDRLRREVDDLMSIVSFVDEQKLFSQLPRYVSGSPDNMPSLRLYQGDMDIIMKLLHNLEHKVEEFGSALAAITRDVRALQARPPESTQASSVINLKSATGVISDVDNRVFAGYTEEFPCLIEAKDRNVNNQHCAAVPSWAAQASTPMHTNNRFALLSADEDCSQEPFTAVVNSRRTKRRQRSSPSQPRQQQQQRQHQEQEREPSQRQPTVSSQQQQLVAQSRRPTIIFGRGAATSTSIAAAKRLRKKAIFCIDNVNSSCSVDNIKSFVSSLSVEVISCYPAKPRRRLSDEADKEIIDRKAFRICINHDHCQRFLKSDVWPDSISIREWKFKEKTVGDGVKRQRISVSDGGASSGVQHADVETHTTPLIAVQTVTDDTVSAVVGSDVGSDAAGSLSRPIDITLSDDTILANYPNYTNE